MGKRGRRGLFRGGARWLWPALLLALCGVMAGVMALMRAGDAGKIADLPRDGVKATVFANRAAEDLTKIAITPPSGKRYAILMQKGEAALEGDANFVFNPYLLAPIIQNARLVASQDTLLDMADAGLSWADFGLEDGCVQVEVAYADGAGIAFSVGSMVPEGAPARYFRVHGDENLYSVSADVYDAYSLDTAQLHQVIDPHIDADLLDEIAFSGENGFHMRLEADGWHMTRPFSYPLDESAVNALLGRLRGVRFGEYVGRAEALPLADYGLAQPRRVVTLSVAPTRVTGYDDMGNIVTEYDMAAYDLTFHCGDDAGDVAFYCLYKDEVVKATRFSAGFLLTQEFAPLLLSAPFNYPTNALTRLVWIRGAEERAYDLTLAERVLPNNEIETDAAGNILYDVLVTRGGEAVDGDAFLRAYMEMAKLRLSARLPDGWTPPAGASPALSVRMEREGASRRVDFYPYDALHWAACVDGAALYYVDMRWADAVALP